MRKDQLKTTPQNLKDYHKFEDDLTFERCSCPSILLVDDEPFNLITLEGMLNLLKANYLIQPTQDGFLQSEVSHFNIEKSYNG